MEGINKIWGKRIRLRLDEKNEIDLLYLKSDTFCSTHTHKEKINRFYVLAGTVRIDTEFGQIVLKKNEAWVVRPPLKHRFVALEDSTMIEMAYVEDGKIDPNDISREKVGGRIINREELTIDDLKEKGLLEL